MTGEEDNDYGEQESDHCGVPAVASADSVMKIGRSEIKVTDCMVITQDQLLGNELCRFCILCFNLQTLLLQLNNLL